jgi:hypothetical protein
MRKLLLLAVLLAGVPNVFAQCNEFYQLKDGGEWTMESYDAKGKLSGSTKQTVTSFDSQGSSFTATVHTLVSDKKGKEAMQGDLEFKCENGTMIIDMRNFINEEQLKAFQNYELKVEAENLEVPGSLSVGQTLKDGLVTVTAADAPIPMTMSVSITDRKVEGKESITTPAGTFECYKITSNSTVQTKMGIGMTLELSSIEWLAPKVAIVKSESYRKGKLQGYTVLTSWKN